MPRSLIASTYKVNAVLVALTIQLITAQVPVNSTALSSPRKAVSSVSIEDRVYFVGGFEFNQKVASDKIEVFNAINQTWMTPLSLPSARGFVTPVVVEPNIYFIGGISQDNPPYFYQPSNMSFVQIQSAGPTVREPIELYLFNSTLTVIGLFSVDFYDLNSGNWSFNSNLTAITMSLTSTRIIAYQEYVFVIGGQDIKTNQISTTAWIFNYRTQQLVRYDNVTTANQTFESSTYDVSNNVLVLRLNDRCLLYHLLRDEWHEELNAIRTVSSFTLNDVTHMLGDNYVLYGWINPVGDDNGDKFIKMGFVINDTIVYVTEDSLVVISGGGQRTPISNSLPTNGPIRFAQQWTSTVYVYADNVRVYVVDIENQTFDTLLDLTQVTSVFVSDGYLHVFDTTNGATWRKYQPSPTTIVHSLRLNFIFAPRALINGLFVDPAYGTLPTSNVNDKQAFNHPISHPFLTAQEDNVFVVMPSTIPANTQRQYQQMDVYNYVNDTWTTKKMPIELFERTGNLSFRETFMEAAVFNDTIMVWSAGVYGIYDVNSDNWTTLTNVSTTATGSPPITRPNRLLNLHYQTPVIHGIAYVHHNGLKYFYKFGPDMLTWEETAPISTDTGDSSIIQQPVAYKETLFVSMRSNDSITSLYFYDTTLKNWQTTLLPSRSPFVAISVAGDYIIAACSDNKLHIFSIRLGQWNTQELVYEIEPSTIIHAGNVTLIGGGTSSSGIYSDTVLIVSDDVVFIEQPQSAPYSDPPSVVEPPAPSGLTIGELVAAIVVPVVVIIAAGLALLLVLLKRRKKKNKRTTTIGLEQQFGEWFTPYNDIEFREQLGQGANGQVFKGKWKNTDVALKVSMTQANQSVISELSLMINMRPHPNVVQLFGFSVHPETNSVILIIEHCNGGSMDNQLMDENAPEISINQKIEWLRGIARGVVHLHSNKIVHRDIAARNVLLHQGEPKLTDFGMSRIVDSQQRGTTKSELGPIRWMSPESLSLKQYSTKSDVWSFGILMYEVIAQQEPHLNADPITTARQIRDEGLTPQVPSYCPPELSTLMKQCWHKTPKQRPTMEQVLQLLEQM